MIGYFAVMKTIKLQTDTKAWGVHMTLIEQNPDIRKNVLRRWFSLKLTRLK